MSASPSTATSRPKTRSTSSKGSTTTRKFWSHHHNPRTVANNPAGEISLNLGITGPHYTIGAACAAGNAGLIQGAQMLRLGEVDVALAGGVSESIHTFGIFASFKSQGALASHDDPAKASRPFDCGATASSWPKGAACTCSNGLSDARARGAKIYGELAGYAMNSDASDFVLPNPERQAECVQLALKRAGISPSEIDIVSTHATGTASGDTQECDGVAAGVRRVANGRGSTTPRASSATRWARPAPWNWPAICPPCDDGVCHATINVDELDPECALEGLVINEPQELGSVDYILNNSFGMLGINSVVIIETHLNVQQSCASELSA